MCSAHLVFRPISPRSVGTRRGNSLLELRRFRVAGGRWDQLADELYYKLCATLAPTSPPSCTSRSWRSAATDRPLPGCKHRHWRAADHAGTPTSSFSGPRRAHNVVPWARPDPANAEPAAITAINTDPSVAEHYRSMGAMPCPCPIDLDRDTAPFAPRLRTCWMICIVR